MKCQSKNKSLITSFFSKLYHILTNKYREPIYRIVEITKDSHDSYVAMVQVSNKSQAFQMRPEEILESDEMTNAFSPMDIRTLTYLGYLELNSPKYKILAKRLSEKDDRILFAIKHKNSETIDVKTALEIASDSEILHNLPLKDAHEIGYSLADEQRSGEQAQKEQLLKKLNCH